MSQTFQNEKKSNKQLYLGIVIVILVSVGLYAYFKYSELFPDTENAYVNSNIINVAPKVTGYIAKVNVKNNQVVKKGQVLFTIDPVDYKFQLDKSKNDEVFANAQYNLAKTNLEKAKTQYSFDQKMSDRYTNLFNLKAVSAQVAEQYQTIAKQSALQLELAKAQAASALSQLGNSQVAKDNALSNYDYTTIRAPFDGYVSNLSLTDGQFVAAGQPLFGLIEDKDFWVDVNYKETQIGRIKPGQKATVILDMYDHKYNGEVKSISYASGNTFSLLPAQNASGNWVKVTQRFTVRVSIKDDQKYPLRVGASAHVEINTKD